MKPSEYAGLDACDLAAAVRAGDVTAKELLDCARERAAAVDPHLNAIVYRMDSAAEARVREPLDGPFAGVPFLIKDLGQDYAGLPTSWGCRGLANRRAEEHSTVVQRWLDAGLVIFGKTNTPEFGAKAITEPALFGPTRNPWDLERTPGGSSGGSAAAVAAGIVPVAGASDGGGSIRIPAACCGLFGLKAGRGLVPSGPSTGEHLQGSATDGVVSRTVRDSAAMLDVLGGPEPSMPYLPGRPERPFAEEVEQEPGRLRVGYVVESATTPEPDPEAVAAVEDAAALLSDLGHDVERVAPPHDDAALARDFLTTWFVMAAFAVETVKRETGAGDEDFEQDTLIVAALGRAVGSVGHMQALENRHNHVRALAGFHQTHDLLLTPTLAKPPIRIGELDTPKPLRIGAEVLLRTRTAGFLLHTGITDQIVNENLGWVPYTQLANITGRPAASVPLHWTAGGLPLGIQLVAPPGGEGLLIRVAAQLERARPWAQRRPELASVA